MKKLGTFLLIAAFAFAFVMPAKSVPRPHPKDAVKTELTAKVVKTDIALKNTTIAVKTGLEVTVTHLNFSEAKRPPGLSVAKANLARFNRYKNRDALIRPKDKIANSSAPPLIRRSC